MNATLQRAAVLLILLAYLLLGALFALRTPDWQAPDEPAHYNYVAQVADGTLLPVIEPGDWDNDYLETLKANGFAPELLDELDTVQYEDHQPPLYYWLLAPVYALSGGSLAALRLASVLLGAGTVLLSYAIARVVLPERPVVALGTMALVAFLPQHVHILASVNNDALAGLVVALLLFMSLRYVRGDRIPLWQMGLLLGVAFISKTTTYFMAGVLLLAVLWRWWQSPTERQNGLRRLAAFALPAGVFALLYWGRNLAVYGVPDFLGLRRHDAVVVGQLRTEQLIAEQGFSAYLGDALQTTFQSFWGQFGWMAAPMHGALPWVYSAIAALLLLAGTGLLLRAFGLGRVGERQPAQGGVLALLVLVLLLSLAQVVYYNLVFVQFQGRYLFTALIPFALSMALGVDTWRVLLLKRVPLAQWLTVGVFALCALLDAYLIWRVIPGALG